MITKVNEPAKTLHGYVVTYVKKVNGYFEHITEIYFTERVAKERVKFLKKAL